MIILVADDNQLNRFTLTSMLEDILTEEDTILEAENGKEMIAVCKERMPDVVFADIKMPYVNGIDAIAECKKHNLDIVFVVVSGYSDFEVAQRALQLNVQDYLLKPVDEEKLSKVMEKIQKKLGEEKEKLNSRFKIELFDAFSYFRTMGEDAEYDEKNHGEDFQYEVISVKSRYLGADQKFYVKLQNEIVQNMEILGKKLLKSKSYYSHIYSEEGTVFFVFCTTANGRRIIHSFVKKMAMQVRRQDVVMHFTCFSRKTMREVYAAYRQADITRGLEMNFSEGSLIDLDLISISEDGKHILKQTSQVIDAWQCGDALTYKEILNNLYQQYRSADADVDMKYLCQYCSNVMQKNIRYDNMKDFCLSLLEKYPLILDDAKNETDMIEMIKVYIERNYMNDIGVAHVAEVFDITPNYLSSIFRQKVGCKFTEYLTDVRVKHAKQLLIQNKTASINDIAAMAGYGRAGYFTMVFQKVTGLKPSDYRKNYMNRVTRGNDYENRDCL